MIKNSTLKTILADITKVAKLKKEQYVTSAKNIAFVEAASGVKLCDDGWDFQYDQNCFNILESDKVAICKVVGTFDPIVGKVLASNYDTTGEILVTVNAMSGMFRNMQFTYRRALLADDDCKAETFKHEAISSWEEKRLICTVK